MATAETEAPKQLKCCCISIPHELEYDKNGIITNKCTQTFIGETCAFCKDIFTEHNPWSGEMRAGSDNECTCETKVHLKCQLILHNLSPGVRAKYGSKIKSCRSCVTLTSRKSIALNIASSISIASESNWMAHTPYYYGSETLNYEVTRYNIANRKQGISELWYFPMDDTRITTPTIMRTIMYQNGQKHGQTIEYARLNYPNPKLIANYKNNVYDGEYTRYFEEKDYGQFIVKEKCNYKAGSKSGIEKIYESSYRLNSENRPIIYLKEEINWLGNSRSGKYREWSYYDKLHLVKECYFLNGIYDLAFPIKEWYRENEPKSEIQFIKDIKTHRGARKTHSIVHVKEWHPNGALKFEGEQMMYNYGFQSYFMDFNFPSIRYHANGKIDSRKTIADDYSIEPIIAPTETTDATEATDTTEILALNDNTLIKVELFYLNGEKSHLYYNVWSSKCEGFLRHGTYINWYKNGSYKEISNHYQGAKEGNYVKYNADGEITSMGVIQINGDNHRDI